MENSAEGRGGDGNVAPHEVKHDRWVYLTPSKRSVKLSISFFACCPRFTFSSLGRLIRGAVRAFVVQANSLALDGRGKNLITHVFDCHLGTLEENRATV